MKDLLRFISSVHKSMPNISAAIIACSICTAFVIIAGTIGTIISLTMSAGSSFLGFAGEHWDLETTTSDIGFSSQHLIFEPSVQENQDPCVDLESYACNKNVEWLLLEHQKEMAEMRYVYYVILRANASILSSDGTDPIHIAYMNCMKLENRSGIECLDEVVIENPLLYCRLIKNGEGMYRKHVSKLQSLLKNMVLEASLDYNQVVSMMKPRIEDLCDRWKRGDDNDGSSVVSTLLSMDRFRIKSRKITPPSFSVFYTNDEWNNRVGDYFWEFQLAHEFAHEFVPNSMNEEQRCDEKAASWTFSRPKTLSDKKEIKAARHAIVSIAQMLCINGEADRVSALGKYESVRALFQCDK